MKPRKEYPSCVVCDSYLTKGEFGLYCNACREYIEEDVSEEDQLASIKAFEEVSSD